MVDALIDALIIVLGVAALGPVLWLAAFVLLASGEDAPASRPIAIARPPAAPEVVRLPAERI